MDVQTKGVLNPQASRQTNQDPSPVRSWTSSARHNTVENCLLVRLFQPVFSLTFVAVPLAVLVHRSISLFRGISWEIRLHVASSGGGRAES